MRAVFYFMAMVLVVVSGCSTKDQASLPGSEPAMIKHYKNSLAKFTDKKQYSLELVMPENMVRMGVNTLELIVHKDTGEDLPGVEVTVIPWMPDMGHGVLETPVVIERGGGLYSIDNIVFSMTGHWQLKIKVAKEGIEDAATFDFPEVKAMGHEHAMLHAAPPADLDLATEKSSEHGYFDVSYTSARNNIRINSFHSWILKVKNEEGQPVDEARISIVGDMPEHGHGFPTAPEITKGHASGEYLVEGLKFSMPGWWVVTFHIEAGDVADDVTFNLMLY
jgi:hypothetical protein